MQPGFIHADSGGRAFRINAGPVHDAWHRTGGSPESREDLTGRHTVDGFWSLGKGAGDETAEAYVALPDGRTKYLRASTNRYK